MSVYCLFIFQNYAPMTYHNFLIFYGCLLLLLPIFQLNAAFSTFLLNFQDKLVCFAYTNCQLFSFYMFFREMFKKCCFCSNQFYTWQSLIYFLGMTSFLMEKNCESNCLYFNFYLTLNLLLDFNKNQLIFTCVGASIYGPLMSFWCSQPFLGETNLLLLLLLIYIYRIVI